MNSEFLNELEGQLIALLTEQRGVAGRKVNDAINNKYRVQIRYNDNLHRRKKGQKGYRRKKPVTGFRLIEPYALGISKAGNRVLRAFQYSGATKRGTPKWKMFWLDRIIDWVPLPDSHFYADPTYAINMDYARYNIGGDKSMTTVINQVKFDNKKLRDPNKPKKEFESPLDRIRRQMGINKSNAGKQREFIPSVRDGEDYEPREMDKILSMQKDNSFDDELDNALGISKAQFDRDSQSAQQKRDRIVNKKRDDRWQYAVDNRKLWRKGSTNDDLMSLNNNEFDDGEDLETKYGENYYDDTYDNLYEPDNYRRRR